MANPAHDPAIDARKVVAEYPWDKVADPPAGSGVMTHEDGRPFTEAEVVEWLAERLRSRASRKSS